MKTLIVLRHAKSSWNTDVLSDHDRPLNHRGRQSAQALGHWLRARGYLPDEILSSSAQRTVETCEGLGFDTVPKVSRDLYLASANGLLSAARAAQGKVVMVVAHNPGIAAFAQALVATPPGHHRFADYPTGALLVVGGISDWATLAPGQGQVLDFIVPRDLI